jgi:hypothetical protein
MAKTRLSRWLQAAAILFALQALPAAPVQAQAAESARYECEPDLIEVMFEPDSRVRMRGGDLQDLGAPALAGVDLVLQSLQGHRWERAYDVPEDKLDEMQARGEANTGRPLYNLNNIYRLRIEGEADVWAVSRDLEALPGVQSAKPVPKPLPPPLPPDYSLSQEYRAPAAWTPTGTSHDFMAHFFRGDGLGGTVCDLEYSWNYNHADISKAAGSQINLDNVVDPFSNDDHGTAVIGMLVADDNGWGITGLCPGASLSTCGTYYGNPPSWNPAGAIAKAVVTLPPGSVILLEQQWDYQDPNTPTADYIPVEWWTDTHPNGQTVNAVHSAILNAGANNIIVVEAGGNGGVNTDNLSWMGSSGAIIVGAGGAYPGGPFGGDDLERLSFSSHGARYDVQGWGENVVTAGYGDLYSSEGHDREYTAIFSGTSSASAHVAGAVTCYTAWKTPSGAPNPIILRLDLAATGTAQVFGLAGPIGPRPDLMRLYLSKHAPQPLSTGGDYGDAPEGVLAYPSLGVMGNFPTDFINGPNSYMIHEFYPFPYLYMGSGEDFEWEGNGGLGFETFFDYDADECQDAAPADNGLLYPRAHTVQGGSLVSCGSGPATLGPACSFAVWGVDLDLDVVNDQADDAYLNVLFDWNQDGEWGGSSACAGQAPELAVENLVIPPTGPSPQLVSTLANPPMFRVGPNEGPVWVRFTLTNIPLSSPSAWDGSWQATGGWFVAVRGETEDYLLEVGAPVSDVLDGGVPGDARAALIGVAPNPFRGSAAVRFRLAETSDVAFDVFDVQGRLARRIPAARLAAGPHSLEWDGRLDSGAPAASGVYVGRVRAEGLAWTVKLYLAR